MLESNQIKKRIVNAKVAVATTKILVKRCSLLEKDNSAFKKTIDPKPFPVHWLCLLQKNHLQSYNPNRSPKWSRIKIFNTKFKNYHENYQIPLSVIINFDESHQSKFKYHQWRWKKGTSNVPIYDKRSDKQFLLMQLIYEVNESKILKS